MHVEILYSMVEDGTTGLLSIKRKFPNLRSGACGISESGVLRKDLLGVGRRILVEQVVVEQGLDVGSS